MLRENYPDTYFVGSHCLRESKMMSVHYPLPMKTMDATAADDVLLPFAISSIGITT